jgi:hypothetical protein
MLALAALLLILACGACGGQGGAVVSSIRSGISNLPSGSGPSTRPTRTTEPPTTEPPTTEPPTTPSTRPTRTVRPTTPTSEPTAPTAPPTTEPPTTEPPTTEPPPTQPPTTQPTTEPPTTEPPTTEPPTTEPTTTEPSTTPSPSASPAASSGGVPPWIWVVIGLAVLAGILVLAAVARRRSRRSEEWRARAIDAYSRGIALHDRLATELLVPQQDRPIVSPEAIAEAERMADGVDASMTAVMSEAPQDELRAAAAQVVLALRDLRLAVRGASVAPAETRDAATAALRERLDGFGRSLAALRTTVRPAP